MKLALIRRQFAATGGAELYLQRLLGALAGAGHELHLFAEHWDQAPAGVALHPVKAGGSRAARPRRFAQAVLTELGAQTFDCVFSLERTLRQDVYRAGDGVHRVWLERRRQFAPWWRKPFAGWGGFHRTMKALEAQTFNPANTGRVIVNSEMVKQEILAHFPYPAERIHLVRNGVEVERFKQGKRAETRARFGVQEDEYLLLFAGSGWERKGLQFLLPVMELLLNTRDVLEKAAQLQRSEWRLSGGAFKSRIKLLVAGKGQPPHPAPPNVIFAGPLSDLENAYAAADLLVFLPIYEPSANVVYEAQAAGLPVVTTVFNGASEILRERESGTIIPDPANVYEVYLAICYWMSGLTPRPVKRRENLSLERNVKETVAVLELAARERRR